MTRKYDLTTLLAGVFVGLLVIADCQDSRAEPAGGASAQTPSKQNTAPASSTAATTSPSNSAAKTGEEEHAHKPGAHGGIITSLGRDSYHVEAVFEKGGVLRLYMLGNDETKVQEVKLQKLTAYVKASDGNEAVPVEIKSQPTKDDTEGTTSAFVGRLPKELAGRNVDVTVPSIRIGAERFRLGFTSAPQSHEEAVMPGKVSDDAERQLYLTPGGLYTEADIKANGNRTASEKIKGLKAKHDLHPKPGDKICPVTLTLANPACTWIIGGKTYEFCCPPCVDNFLEMAKNEKTVKDVLDPKEYVKK